MNRVRLNQSHDLVGLFLEGEWPNETQGLVLQKADALYSVNGHF